MQHTVEDLIRKINVMVDISIKLRIERIKHTTYDKELCTHLLDQIQQLAAEIAADRSGDEIKTEALNNG